MFNKKLYVAVCFVVRESLKIKKNENVLIIIDENVSRNIGRSFFEAVKETGAEAVLTEIVPRSYNGEEPPLHIARTMLESDVIIALTSKSLTLTSARKKANDAGARIASLPGITAETIKRAVYVDYAKIQRLTHKISHYLNQGKEIYLTNDKGTEVKFSISGRAAISDTGILDKPGAIGNLPAGESFIAPVEGTAEGIVIIDGVMAGVGKLNKPIRIEVKNGIASLISGGEEADKLTQLLDFYGDFGRNIAEFGIGTNYKAKLTDNILESEKMMGTVHIAFGNNSAFGGKISVPIHLDGIITNPTVMIDGQEIMRSGNFIFLDDKEN